MEKHIQEELERIGERLSAGPDPYQHAGLYAAQQALSWAAQPEAFASPFASVTGIKDITPNLLAEPIGQ